MAAARSIGREAAAVDDEAAAVVKYRVFRRQVHYAAVQFQISADSWNPPVFQEFQFGLLQAVEMDVAEGEGLGHQFFTLALVLGDSCRIE